MGSCTLDDFWVTAAGRLWSRLHVPSSPFFPWCAGTHSVSFLCRGLFCSSGPRLGRCCRWRGAPCSASLAVLGGQPICLAAASWPFLAAAVLIATDCLVLAPRRRTDYCALLWDEVCRLNHSEDELVYEVGPSLRGGRRGCQDRRSYSAIFHLPEVRTTTPPTSP